MLGYGKCRTNKTISIFAMQNNNIIEFIHRGVYRSC